ncbi:MAG: hypothetical protein Q8K43_02490, partial [Sulfurimicrobium sp.]|nr:hypothetical protein [Sulfurimicrobium sp.]
MSGTTNGKENVSKFKVDLVAPQGEQNPAEKIETTDGLLNLRPSEKISSNVFPIQLESLNNDPKDLWER